MPAMPLNKSLNPQDRFPQAIEAMRYKAFLDTVKYRDQQLRANREGADPLIIEFSQKLVRAGARMGIPLYAHCIVRTVEDQQAAYALGRSRNDGSKPYPHRAFAVDIIHGVYGWMDNPKIDHAWDVIGHLGFNVASSMSIDIEWGGGWTFYDPAHFELKDWRDRYQKRFSGTVER